MFEVRSMTLNVVMIDTYQLSPLCVVCWHFVCICIQSLSPLDQISMHSKSNEITERVMPNFFQ